MASRFGLPPERASERDRDAEERLAELMQYAETRRVDDWHRALENLGLGEHGEAFENPAIARVISPIFQMAYFMVGYYAREWADEQSD